MKVNETFLSLQGEGPLSGILTFFIRFSGCNLRCTYCDTTYAYEEGINLSISDIVKRAKASNTSNICITGGEPLLQKDIGQLVDKLIKECFVIDLETNGSIALPEWTKNKSVVVSLDIKTPSSGMSEKMQLNNIKKLTAKDLVKFVIGSSADYEFARKMIKEIKKAQIYFHPVFGRYELKELAENIIRDKLPNVKLGVQLHKIIWQPSTRGV